MTRAPVLADHKRVKSKLITPFNDQLGPLNEVSWVNTIIPELLWIALIQVRWGPHRCVEILTAFTRDLRASHVDRVGTVWAAAGEFEQVPTEELKRIVLQNEQNYGAELKVALRPLAALYPREPLSGIHDAEEMTPSESDNALIKSVLTDLFDRSSVLATMTQAHAVWLAFDSGCLKVSADTSLAQFPRIDEYPETELSRRIAGAIRASINGFFGAAGPMCSNSEWPIKFWNRGLELEPCEGSDE